MKALRYTLYTLAIASGVYFIPRLATQRINYELAFSENSNHLEDAADIASGLVFFPGATYFACRLIRRNGRNFEGTDNSEFRKNDSFRRLSQDNTSQRGF